MGNRWHPKSLRGLSKVRGIVVRMNTNEEEPAASELDVALYTISIVERSELAADRNVRAPAKAQFDMDLRSLNCWS